jgi:hypothetical protein
MTTTFRSDVVAAVLAVLNAQIAATPTQLRKAWSSRPGAFPETPCAFIGGRDEQITYTAGTRNRQMVGLTVTLVDTFNDNTETGDRLDDLVDLLVDRFTAAHSQVAGGSSILELASVTDSTEEVGGVNGPILYRSVILGFATTFERVGRV